MFEHSLVYTFEKLYLMAALLAAIILTTALAACTYSANLPGRRKSSLLALLTVALVLQTAQFLAVVSPPREAPFFVQVQLMSLCLLGPGFFYLSAAVLNNRFASPRTLIPFFLPPAAGLLLIPSNGLHNLFFTVHSDFHVEYLTLSHFISASNYLCAAAALVLLVLHRRRNGGPVLGRMAAAAAGAVSFVLAVDVFEFFNPRFFLYDLTPASLGVAQLLFLCGILRLKEFRSLLSTRIKVLDSLNETVVVTDPDNNIVYFNETPLSEQLGIEIGAKMGAVREWPSPSGELTLNCSSTRHFFYYIHPLGREKDDPTGKLYSFRDVTEYKTLIARLDEKNKELLSALAELQKQTSLIKQLTEETERNRILKQVNSTVGHYIHQIIRNLETARSSTGTQDEEIGEEIDEGIKERIQDSIRCARTGIEKIRESVSLLAGPRETEEEGGGKEHEHDQGVDR
jgi:signal transduction histidine kinase